MKKATYTISDLADEFSVSNRTIRFYEEKGLISPARTKGNQRRYSELDRFRLKWVLRGKRFGYSLDEIAKMLGLTDTGMSAVQQIKTTLAYGDKKLNEISERIHELKIMQQEIKELKQKLQHRLDELQKTQDIPIELSAQKRMPDRYDNIGEINMTDIFNQLARHLDQLPGGYPATDDGLELRILKRLFSPQEAQIAVALTLNPEPAETIAQRLAMDADDLKPILRDMAGKGLIFHRQKKDVSLFMAAQFVIGIWEYHVNSLDEGLIEDFNAYVPYLAEQWKGQKTKQLRVVPISKSVSADMKVMPYEIAETIISEQSKIVVAPCICRKEQKMIGKGCDNPMEVCLVFGTGAYYYEENGLGRNISRDEALQILHDGAEAGLVLQPGNAQKAINICMCCGCCCQILKNVKTFDKPAKAVNSSYYVRVDANACIACGTCEERCHMEAIAVNDTAAVDLDRCIGCGACIPSCDVEALALVVKPEKEQWVPPKTPFETYFSIAKERGLI